jgi:hypothetical protein
MNVSSRDLAAGLARVLDEVIPDGLSVRSAGSSLAVYSDGVVVGSSAALEILDDADDSGLTARIETAARAALSGVQDVIIEIIRSPWPATPGGGSDLPQPDCRVEGQELLVWFGAGEAPLLALPAIQLAPASD